MKIYIDAGEIVEVTDLVTQMTWSGNMTQAARRLEFSYVQSATDANIRKVRLDCGYTISLKDGGNEIFRGNVYAFESDREKSLVKVTAFDNIYVANRSKLSRKIEETTAESVTRSVCKEAGIKIGNLAYTGVAVNFIAHGKTARQIIETAYEEAGKQTGKKYFIVMKSDYLNVIEKGVASGVTLDSSVNMTGSIYKKSIENLVNRADIADGEGNNTQTGAYDEDSVSKYSMIIDTLKTQKDKDMAAEAKAALSKPEREGTVTALGNVKAITGYSVTVKDANLNGRFIIKSDTHNFSGGSHIMKLTLEFAD